MTLTKFEWKPREKKLFYSFIAIGIATFFIGLSIDPERAWANYLLNYFYWLCIALAGIFFTALQFITGSKWSVTIRRVPESFYGYLPIAAILFLGLVPGYHVLYEWTHHDVVLHDPLLSSKTIYLNPTFFFIRGMILLGVCFVMGGWIIRNSVKQDESGDNELTHQNTRIAAPFLLLFAWLFTFSAMDLMMSLEPHWFSTIFGVYCWSGLFGSGLAMITLGVILLKKRGNFGDAVNENHLHDLGKLLFAFLVFWTYIAFSQFMLIWYANLPEETFYMIDRVRGPWEWVSVALVFVKFFLPFFMLVSRFAKRSWRWMTFMGFWFLAAQWVDVYWMVFPSLFEAPVFGWMEIGLYLGFAGLFFLSVGQKLSSASPVPLKDPRLQAALHFHQ